MKEINQGSEKVTFLSDKKEGLMILLFAVHAFNALRIVYQWMNGLSGMGQISVDAISASRKLSDP
ncbi:MAG: hypothetical protein WBL02_06055 [Methanomethylovorans sp.]|uniref:hypothetical protein n=1 Tax=Methanomethylovorans sp. TaxID=2758717 RepID=UPI000B1DBAF5